MGILKFYAEALKVFCKQNQLDYNKAISFPRCGNDNVLFIQRVDRNKVGSRKNNNTPAEVLISAFVDENGTIQFTKGENADKYLHQ